MNILILTDYFPPDKLGGVGEIAKHLQITYEDKGHECWVLTTGNSNSSEKIKRSSTSLLWGTFVNNLHAISIIRRNNIDVVNMHQSSTTLFLLTRYIPFLYKKFPKVVNSFQVSYFSEFKNIETITVREKSFRPKMKEYIEKWLFAPLHIIIDFIGYALSDEITVVSSENKKEFLGTYNKVVKKPIHIIPNGVNTDIFKPAKPSLEPTLLDKLKDNTVLLYIGVFRVRKRVFNLLYALEEVVKKNGSVKLVLIGGGRNYEEEILSLANELGLSEHILFLGRIPNEQVIEYLNASDVFCLISSYEGMPIAILEAMSSGTAVLSTRVSGMIDLLEHGKTGMLVEVDDIDATADALSKLVDDEKQTIQLGRNARKTVLNEYTWDLIADKYIELFNK